MHFVVRKMQKLNHELTDKRDFFFRSDWFCTTLHQLTLCHDETKVWRLHGRSRKCFKLDNSASGGVFVYFATQHCVNKCIGYKGCQIYVSQIYLDGYNRK